MAHPASSVGRPCTSSPDWIFLLAYTAMWDSDDERARIQTSAVVEASSFKLDDGRHNDAISVECNTTSLASLSKAHAKTCKDHIILITSIYKYKFQGIASIPNYHLHWPSGLLRPRWSTGLTNQLALFVFEGNFIVARQVTFESGGGHSIEHNVSTFPTPRRWKNSGSGEFRLSYWVEQYIWDE